MSRARNGSMFCALVVWISCHGIVLGISVNVDPVKPALGNSMTVTCQRSSSSSASISWDVDSSFLTTCDGSNNDVCIPSPTGYTFSTDVSANQFNLTRAAITLTDCKTFACTDTVTNSDTILKNIQLADYNKNDITQTEPGANTDGSISITTGCVFSADDLTITWSKIVDGSSVALSADDPSPVTSTDRSTCTRTCHTDEDKKATSGFTHTEYTGTESETFQYMVTVSHSSYPDNADIYTWTSANYTQMKAIPTTENLTSISTTTPTTTTNATSTTKTSTVVTTTTSSGNESTVIIVSSVLGGLFLIGIVITIVLRLLSQRRGHDQVRNHRHHDQDRRYKRRDHHRYPSWQDHGQYNNASYMEYSGMGTQMNPLYVPYRSAHRAEQNYYLGHPSTDHQSYTRNQQIYYERHYNNVRPQTDMHSYQPRYYGGRGGNNISSRLPRDENNYVAPDYELYW